VTGQKIQPFRLRGSHSPITHELRSAMQEPLDVGRGQDWCAGRHTKGRNPIAKLDLGIDQPLEQAFDKGID
jgi:hypothetical protein